MIPKEVVSEIQKRLHNAEREHGVKILLAVESGSRAWGFESPNSDYDVRFIYCHPLEHYLSIGLEDQRDVIEYPITDEIDLSGWDIRKALRLFWKSNPAIVEWIQSPIIYLEYGDFAQRVRALLPTVYNCESGIYHYRSMAKTNFRGYLRNDLVPLKKYFYVLRPLLSVHWLERYGKAPPIEFEHLLHLIDHKSALLEDILQLLERKKQAPELGLAPPVLTIKSFVEQELMRLENVLPKKYKRVDVSLLDEVFLSVISKG